MPLLTGAGKEKITTTITNLKQRKQVGTSRSWSHPAVKFNSVYFLKEKIEKILTVVGPPSLDLQLTGGEITFFPPPLIYSHVYSYHVAREGLFKKVRWDPRFWILEEGRLLLIICHRKAVKLITLFQAIPRNGSEWRQWDPRRETHAFSLKRGS